MDWKDVGGWLKKNAAPGAALVGELVTGNIPAAIATGISMVSSATGQADPEKALMSLQTDPQTMVKLKELYNQNEASIRDHLAQMHQMELEDAQKEQEQTQLTIRSGDNSQDPVVRRTRPLQSWLSLVAGIGYIFYAEKPDTTILEFLFALPLTYAGLRQIGKGIDVVSQAMVLKKGTQ